MAERVKPYSPRMFANTNEVCASAKHSAIRGMCVDQDMLVFAIALILFILFKKKGFSQLT